jgi:hypothetical protein
VRHVLILVAFALPVLAQTTDRPTTTVVLAQNAPIRQMVQTGLQTLTGQPTPAAAWLCLVATNDIVGIKVATQAGPLLASHRAVVDALVAGLQQAGVPATNIWVWDRDPAKFRLAGYGTTGMVHEAAVLNDTGWDADRFYENKIVGRLIWGDLLFGRTAEPISTRSHLPRLLTRTVTKLINVPVLRAHDGTAVAGCLHNLSLGLVDNARRFEDPGPVTDQAIAEINALSAVRGKTVLHVLDALVGGYAGGDTFKPRYGWECGRLYFSTDPVALDSLALDLIEAKRREAGLSSLADRARCLGVAGRLGLGQADRQHINVLPAR